MLPTSISASMRPFAPLPSLTPKQRWLGRKNCDMKISGRKTWLKLEEHFWKRSRQESRNKTNKRFAWVKTAYANQLPKLSCLHIPGKRLRNVSKAWPLSSCNTIRKAMWSVLPFLEAPSKSIGDAVVTAVKQWKFVPSKKEDGTPVSVRGKLTFYFEIDKDGNGRVQNPKQYR